MTEHKAFRFQLKPTPQEETQLERMAGARRWVYNWALARRRDSYKATGKSIGWAALSQELTMLKYHPETAWLKEIGAQLLQQALADVKRSFDNFFAKRAHYPRFKRKKDAQQSFRLPQRVRIEDGKVYCPKVGWLCMRQSQPVDCPTKSATFKRDATGKWFVTLVGEFALSTISLPPVIKAEVVGGDIGLSTFLTLSDGTRVENPRFYRKAEHKLRRAQRRLSRRQKGSHNRTKARKHVAKVHKKIAHQRTNFTHQLSHLLVTDYLGLCLETLSLTGLAKTKLSKSILDAAFGELFRQLQYKSRWENRHFVQVARFFPSSQLCSICGYKNRLLTLADRIWTCPQCGTEHDRDLNAAENIREEGWNQILAAGHAERINACGQDIRPAIAGSSE